MEDDELISRAVDGDQLAFRQLVETYALLAERTALALLDDASMAEDAVQEAWMDVWRALPRFELGRPFRPWLLTIVANRARKQTRRLFPIWVPLNLSLLANHAADDNDSPLTWPQPDDDLGVALAQLSPDHRQVLALRYLADLDLEEIAQMTGTPIGTVKSRLHRALRALRSRLESEAKTSSVRAGAET